MKAGLAIRKAVGTPFVISLVSTPISINFPLEITSSLSHSASAIMVSNTSTVPVHLFTGIAGSDETGVAVPPGAINLMIPVTFNKGIRIVARAENQQILDADTGFFLLTLFQ